ncbi:MAG TPA: PP2C family protein-serine/threonine phosphatase [Candidatus Sulfotelmatobacter sp.]|nr:PP2C family protein-serine/threonine phosphatase [Candidatus Sulfotelmatobacter sp.]
MDSINGADAALQTLRGDVINIVLGTVFLTAGATACVIAAIRGRRGVRILVWWGIFSGMYGLQTLGQSSTILTILPYYFRSVSPYVITSVRYLLLVSALFAWRELTLGKLRFLIHLEILFGSAIAVLGIGTFVLGGPADKWIFYNNLLVVLATPVMLAIVLVPRSSRFLVMPIPRILAASMLIFGLEVLYTNLGTVLQYRALPLVDSVGFALLLFSLGYVALEVLFTNERRLLSIETELETARQIQSSILPAMVPELENLCIAASYQPMTGVAGDFYQFVHSDNNHLGILVADVSGHGIPAALISSMIKVAMQSVAIHAHDPAQVLGGLNRILSSEAPGQFASAAYVWIDTKSRNALYSAAGHPPLLCWRNTKGEMQRIESNGLLFGVEPDATYPVCSVPIEPSDRFLLYTDGVTETENAAAEAFGDEQLERIVRNHRRQSAPELSRQVLSELQRWRPAAMKQQDDLTLIVVDVL